MAGLCTPRPTLRRRPYGRLRTARARCGSLLLHREGLALSTSCRSPGALRKSTQIQKPALGANTTSVARDGSGSIAQPIAKIRDEFLGVHALQHGARVGPNRADGLHIAGNVLVLVDRLRVVGGEHDARQRDLAETDAHPFGAPIHGVMAPLQAGAIGRRRADLRGTMEKLDGCEMRQSGTAALGGALYAFRSLDFARAIYGEISPPGHLIGFTSHSV